MIPVFVIQLLDGLVISLNETALVSSLNFAVESLKNNEEVTFLMFRVVHWFLPFMSKAATSQSVPPQLLKATLLVFMKRLNYLALALYTMSPGVSEIVLPRYSTNLVYPSFVNPATRTSLKPFVKPMALIYPVIKIDPSVSTVKALEYSLNDGVPIYLTKVKEVGLDLSQAMIKISRNPEVKLVD